MKILKNYNFINKSNRVPTIKLCHLNNWPIKWNVSLLFGSQILKVDSSGVV